MQHSHCALPPTPTQAPVPTVCSSKQHRDAGIACANQQMATLLTADYWRRLAAEAAQWAPGGAPPLHCDDAATQGAAAAVKLPAARTKDLRHQMDTAGVAQVRERGGAVL
jgi:hypothetical protein